jgi:hypothetical protein
MKVLVSPKAARLPGAEAISRLLAGEDGVVVHLGPLGVTNLARRLSEAEIHAVRRALEGMIEDGVAGYVCSGRAPGASGPRGRADAELPRALPVADHANLTWVSPLAGPNEAVLGPRFAAAVGIYRPKLVQSLLTGMFPLEEPGAVVQVSDPDRPTAFVLEASYRLGSCWFSDELTSVALLAAHRGLAVAAVVLEASASVGASGRTDDA